ncbi:MAG: isoprenylcysteine carboxylmethyltransferase family protein [Anaerolineales bacterium]|jgi:protein-S-isoprenylcysteine O-methyltransferase Ste14
MNKSKILGLIVVVSYTALFFASHFIAAGTFNLPFSWIILGIYLLIAVTNVFLADPGLISERLKFGGEGVNRKDQILASVSFFFFFPITLVVAGLDRGRFGWTQSLPVAIQIAGVVLYVLGNMFARWAIVSNRYFSTFVRIQTNRDHIVISRGPYGIIRHPGYAGAILAAISLPLALGSGYALAPAFVGGVGFVLRTDLEDKELIRKLSGYRDYASKVRYRLLPGVW